MLLVRSPGRIASASVQPFAAMSAEGQMLVVVENNGTLDSDFTVGVSLPLIVICFSSVDCIV